MRLTQITFLVILFISAAGATLVADDKVPGDRLFGVSKVVQLHLKMTEKQFTALNPPAGARFGGGPNFGQPFFGPVRPTSEDSHRNTFGVEFPWSRGELTCLDETFEDVGVRYKGNYTFMATARSLKKSLKIDLNRNVKGQKLDGLTMLNLNCGVSDPSESREIFSYAFFRDAGVPAPRTAFAELTLTVPGKYEREFVGVYALIEQVNKGFLKLHFQDGTGMLLKPEGLQGGLAHFGLDWRVYAERYKPDNDPTDEQKQRLIEFTRLINHATDEEFAKQIGDYLDIDAFLRFVATNALLSNLDSFLGYGHNYYLYLVPSTNRFVFIPWDLDLSMATWPAGGMPEQMVQLSLEHPHMGSNKLIDRLFAIEQIKKQYLAMLEQIVATKFTKERLSNRLDDIENALKDPMSRESTAVSARNEGRGGNGFGFGGPGNGQFGQTMPPRRFINKRTESVAAQLAGKSKGYVPQALGMGFGPRPQFSGDRGKK